MIRICIINPNSTASMTASIETAAQAAASASTKIIALQNNAGPASIQGPVDGANAVPGLLDCIVKAEQENLADAYIIACFDDTGLDAARMLTTKPVFGIGEAAARIASIIAKRFTIVTTLAVSVPALEQNMVHYGLRGTATVRASGIPVLAIETDTEASLTVIGQHIQEAISAERAEAIVLGCAGMADLARELSDRHNIPVIEGVSSAVKLAELMVGLDLQPRKAA